MQVTSIGGGPGGLYAALLLQQSHPDVEVTVYERNAPDDTFGFGVVFSAATLAELEDADAPSFDALMRACARWDPVDVHFRGEVVRARGNRFAAISRKRLLFILQQRCEAVGVRLVFRTEVSDPAEYLDADLVLAADGVNSATRRRFEASFRPDVRTEGCKFIWLGTTKRLESFTFSFRENEHGWFQAHAYPYDEALSTWIVECDEATWRRAGLDHSEGSPLPPGESDLASIAYLEELFAPDLAGHPLLANNSKWLDWQTVRNGSWRHEHVVLLGDAAHTAHFSIGSGTKLALEDAIALATAVRRCGSVDAALAAYESSRRAKVERLQDAAVESMRWFGRYQRYTHFAPPQFAYSLLTRSGRVTYDSMRSRDPGLMSAFERWFSATAAPGRGPSPVPPSAVSLEVGKTTIDSRVVVSVPTGYEAEAGRLTPAAVAPMAAGARGAGLALVERVAVSADARITSGCPGLYDDVHTASFAALADAVHEGSSTLLGVQLVHAGRRGATHPRVRGTDRPLPRDRAWPIVGPGAEPYRSGCQVPTALDETGMRAVLEAFVEAARRAEAAGVDLLEVNCAHGYLLGSFLSPLTNPRDVGARLRFPLDVVDAVRAVWPDDMPLSVCLNGSDLQHGGITEDEVVAVARILADHGVSLLHVVSGQTTPAFVPSYEPGFNVKWSDLVRNVAGAPTITSGGIATPWAADDVLAAGRADVCVVGEPHDPGWYTRAMVAEDAAHARGR